MNEWMNGQCILLPQMWLIPLIILSVAPECSHAHNLIVESHAVLTLFVQLLHLSFISTAQFCTFTFAPSSSHFSKLIVAWLCLRQFFHFCIPAENACVWKPVWENDPMTVLLAAGRDTFLNFSYDRQRRTGLIPSYHTWAITSSDNKLHVKWTSCSPAIDFRKTNRWYGSCMLVLVFLNACM